MNKNFNSPNRVGGSLQNRKRSFVNAGDHIVKRMSNWSVLTTGAGTSITQTVVSGDAASANEFASFAARYLQYRVRQIRITGKAVQPIQTATVTHSALVRGDFIGATSPATVAQIVSSESFKSNATCSDFVHVTTWDGVPDAKLWQPTSAAIPTADQFGFVCSSIASPALLTGTVYYVSIVEFEVEFRGTK